MPNDEPTGPGHGRGMLAAHEPGIHGFSEPDPAFGRARPITSLGRNTQAIWNILHQQRLRSRDVPCET